MIRTRFAFCCDRTAAIIERGLNFRYGKKFRRDLSPMCLPSTTGSYTRIGLKDADFALLIVFYGHLVGLTVLLVEFLLRKLRKIPCNDRIFVHQLFLVRPGWP